MGKENDLRRELRIGNLVLGKGKIETMHCISLQYPFLNTMEYGVGAIDWKDIEPIPLTEEWLLKCGYKSRS